MLGQVAIEGKKKEKKKKLEANIRKQLFDQRYN